ncbi:hypothetical protein G9A89_002190 [Geosiphon pyriformis]|nr:hypothetical protein G9A89_002190 [Geosiphon pyriformis]
MSSLPSRINRNQSRMKILNKSSIETLPTKTTTINHLNVPDYKRNDDVIRNQTTSLLFDIITNKFENPPRSPLDKLHRLSIPCVAHVPTLENPNIQDESDSLIFTRFFGRLRIEEEKIRIKSTYKFPAPRPATFVSMTSLKEDELESPRQVMREKVERRSWVPRIHILKKSKSAVQPFTNRLHFPSDNEGDPSTAEPKSLPRILSFQRHILRRKLP